MRIGRKICTALFYSFILLAGYNLKAQNLANLKNEKPITIKGTLGGTMTFYDVTGKQANRKPFVWLLTGSPTVSVYGITFPFSFTVSEQQRDFRQPFNKFGVSPYYKWMKLHLGYRSVTFSPYTLAGHTILGAGTELTPGNFRFGFMYGRLLKAINPNQQTLQLDNSAITTPAFERKAWSMKVGYGTEKNNADLIFLKGWDDPNSITLDSTNRTLMPAENFIASFVTHQQFAGKFHFDLQLAQSLYTNDLNADTPDSSSHKLLNIFSGFYTTNATTGTSNAVESSLGYGGMNFSLNLHYKRIDPGYRSMGAYFFQNDLQNITIEPSVRLGQQKYSIGGSLGFQRDNLNNDLPATTHRTIGSVSLNATPSQIYNLNITYSNYDLGQSAGQTSVDSLYEISQTTQNLAISQNVNISGKSLTQNIMLTYSFQKLKDKNDNTANLNSYNSSTLMANYMLFFMNAGLSLNLSFNYTLYNLQNSKNKITGPGIVLTKTLMKNKLSLSLADNYFKNSNTFTNGNDDRITGVNRISFQAGLKPSKHHRFYVKFYINKSTAITSNIIPFTERKGDIGYVYSF